MRACFRPSLWLAAGLSLAPTAHADTGPADVSPFLSVRTEGGGARGGAGGQASDGHSYELRGIMSTDGVLRFCIFDPAIKSSVWVGLDEPGNSFVVKAADPDHETVTLQAGDGRRLTLALREGKVVSMNPGRGIPAAAAPSPVGASNTILNPTPDDNQRRLQAIADEVRRRRLMRQQAQQGGASPNGQPNAPSQR